MSYRSGRRAWLGELLDKALSERRESVLELLKTFLGRDCSSKLRLERELVKKLEEMFRDVGDAMSRVVPVVWVRCDDKYEKIAEVEARICIYDADAFTSTCRTVTVP